MAVRRVTQRGAVSYMTPTDDPTRPGQKDHVTVYPGEVHDFPQAEVDRLTPLGFLEKPGDLDDGTAAELDAILAERGRPTGALDESSGAYLTGAGAALQRPAPDAAAPGEVDLGALYPSLVDGEGHPQADEAAARAAVDAALGAANGQPGQPGGLATDDELAAMKVEELLAYVNQHNGERDRVLTLEEARPAKSQRKTVLAIRDTIPAP